MATSPGPAAHAGSPCLCRRAKSSQINAVFAAPRLTLILAATSGCLFADPGPGAVTADAETGMATTAETGMATTVETGMATTAETGTPMDSETGTPTGGPSDSVRVGATLAAHATAGSHRRDPDPR